MRLKIDLAPGEEEQLAELAAQQRVSAADYVHALIQSHIMPHNTLHSTPHSHTAIPAPEARRP